MTRFQILLQTCSTKTINSMIRDYTSRISDHRGEEKNSAFYQQLVGKLVFLKEEKQNRATK